MVLELIKAVALLLALSLLIGYVSRLAGPSEMTGKALSGLVFGSISIIGMLVPIELEPGVIFDPRSVIVSMAGLFGGVLVGGIAAVLAGGYRAILGGGGVYVGVAVVVMSLALGLAYRYCHARGWVKVGLWELLAFGLVVHVAEVGLFTLLPADAVAKVMHTVALPLVLTFTPATAILGLMLRDIEARRRVESELEVSQGRLALHIQNTPLGAIYWDRDLRAKDWNKAAEEIFGYTAEEAIGRHAAELLIPQNLRTEIDGVFEALMSRTGGTRNINENTTKDGRTIVCEWYNTRIDDHDGKPIGCASLVLDVTDQKHAEEMIWKQAHFDSLTGLPNRDMFNTRMEEEIKRAQRYGKRIALLYLDLDRFKDVNDNLGHHTGDALLVEAARRLKACVRTTDMVARMGGDEFVIIAGEIERSGAIEGITYAIQRALTEPFVVDSERIHMTTSIGVTFYPDDGTDVSVLQRNADQSMYAAKALGRNRVHYFEPAMHESGKTRMTLINDMRSALADEQLHLVYQPIVNLATGNVEKAEALLRWTHPTRGLVSPVDFVPLAEETGMIVDIGNWVFFEAARQAASWRKAFRPDFQVSVNTSPVQYRDENLPLQSWLGHLGELGLPGKAVVIEITEGLLMSSHVSVSEKLLAFRDRGIQVAIDDFGTGYSSLAYLKKFDIDYLKIDRSFVSTLSAGSDELALCEAVIVMAHKLKLKVIAEGVETDDQRRLLEAAGCDFAQGYVFSRPVPADRFEQFMSAGGQDRSAG